MNRPEYKARQNDELTIPKVQKVPVLHLFGGKITANASDSKRRREKGKGKFPAKPS